MTHYARCEEDVEPQQLRNTIEKITAALSTGEQQGAVDDVHKQQTVLLAVSLLDGTRTYNNAVGFCIQTHGALGGNDGRRSREVLERHRGEHYSSYSSAATHECSEGGA